MNRRGFLALLGLSPLAANLAARAASEATIVGIDGGADERFCMVFRMWSEQQRLGFSRATCHATVASCGGSVSRRRI
jgi:hypothetical protein